MSNKARLRKQLWLIRDAARIYFKDDDKHDLDVAERRREAAEDIRYFHNKWLTAKPDGQL